MVDENNENIQNYVELTESQIFEKIKNDLNPIQENLSEKRMTIEDAKDELKKINERIQWTKLEQEKKKEIWNTFDNLINNLEENFEKNNLKTEFNEIVSLLERLIQKDLANLKLGIQQNKQRRNPERPTEVQEWINLASNNLESLPDNDTNWIANRALKKIHEYLW